MQAIVHANHQQGIHSQMHQHGPLHAHQAHAGQLQVDAAQFG
ncbi:hypothetical protein ACFFLM_00400 [Deinococcus oregonensis]|uniref:Uncharacterized protein n=1 Tax=Deinococcus oregonensis TaxID=1805970 RepID=A0ABV6ASH4_9DEIO